MGVKRKESAREREREKEEVGGGGDGKSERMNFGEQEKKMPHVWGRKPRSEKET